VSGVTPFQLLLGTTGPGSSDVYAGPQTSNTSVTVSNVPYTFTRSTLYARLLYWQNSTQEYSDATYIEPAAKLPALISPRPSSTLTDSSATFYWGAGIGPTSFRLQVGTLGTGSSDIYNGTAAPAAPVTVSNIPFNGAKLYVRLNYLLNSIWSSIDYTLTEFKPPSLNTPAPGSTLTGSSATFSWDPGAGATRFELLVGTGPGRGDIYRGDPTTATSIPVSNIPAQGRKIFAQLYYLSGKWHWILYRFTEAP
jgi:hypothetical protein